MARLSREEKMAAAEKLSDPDRPLQKILDARFRKEPGIPGREGDDSEALLKRSADTAAERAKRSIGVMKRFSR